MDTIMIDVFFTGKPVIPVTFVKLDGSSGKKIYKSYGVSRSRMHSFALWANHSQAAGTGKVLPFYNGWSWMSTKMEII